MSKKAELIRIEKDWYKKDRPSSDADVLAILPKRRKVPSKVYTVKELMQLLKCQKDLIYGAVKSGELFAHRVGSRGIRVDEAALEDYLNRPRRRA
jgi:excisionase family DNA binding protein